MGQGWVSRWSKLVLVWFCVLLAGCASSGSPGGVSQDRLGVVVSILPQRYFVERIGGEYVEVSVMVEPGSSPVTYEPKPEQLRMLGEAQVYFGIGVPFEEAWLGRISAANETLWVVDTTAGIELLPMAEHNHEAEGDQEDSEHRDPHIWLSPRLVGIQAQTIYEALVELDPDHASAYASNLADFLAEIDQLDAEIRALVEGLDNRRFIVFHPAWGYFAHEYGLDMVPIEVGGQEPSAAELAELVTLAREEEIRVIFVQPEFSTRAAETIAAEIDGEVVVVSSLALDWPDNLRRVAAAFAAALGG